MDYSCCICDSVSGTIFPELYGCRFFDPIDTPSKVIFPPFFHSTHINLYKVSHGFSFMA